MALLTPQSRAHRADLAELVGVALRDLRVLFGQFDTATDARDGLMDVLPRLTTIYGEAAATLGADWYDDLRDESGARGRFRAIPAGTAPRGQTDALARWSVGPLFATEPNFPSALTLASGGVQRLIANTDRETVRMSSIQDRDAKGWVRMGSGECDWCRERLDGEVHHSEASSFGAHDHCNCTAVPAF